MSGSFGGLPSMVFPDFAKTLKRQRLFGFELCFECCAKCSFLPFFPSLPLPGHLMRQFRLDLT